MVKEALKRTQQALEAEPAVAPEPAAADANAGGGAGALAGKAQARAKKADGYHAHHAEWVAEFNALTGNECAGGAGGVKWAAVRAWQQKHWQLNNLLADGLVGPKTLEAEARCRRRRRGRRRQTQARRRSRRSIGTCCRERQRRQASAPEDYALGNGTGEVADVEELVFTPPKGQALCRIRITVATGKERPRQRVLRFAFHD